MLERELALPLAGCNSQKWGSVPHSRSTVKLALVVVVVVVVCVCVSADPSIHLLWDGIGAEMIASHSPTSGSQESCLQGHEFGRARPATL